jgi:hypothetical protein
MVMETLQRTPDAIRQVDADRFARAVAEAAPVQKGPMQIADMLTQYTPEEYAKMRTFLSRDAGSGFALKDGDELVSVFSAPRGRGEQLAMEAAARGARRLDNFDIEGKLPELYGKAGFRETERFGYDPQYADALSPYVNAAKPDVVMMNMDPAVSEALSRLRFAGEKDVRNIVAGGRGRISRNKNVQDAAALAALAALIGEENR